MQDISTKVIKKVDGIYPMPSESMYSCLLKQRMLNQSVILAFRVVILEHSVTTFFWKILPNSELIMTRPNFDNITLTRPELTLVLSLTYGC